MPSSVEPHPIPTHPPTRQHHNQHAHTHNPGNCLPLTTYVHLPTVQEQQLDYSESAAIANLVEGSFYVYQQAQAVVPAHELPDGRVDLCLLLLPTGGPSLPLAASAASHIANAVPVLPIIAKVGGVVVGLGWQGLP